MKVKVVFTENGDKQILIDTIQWLLRSEGSESSNHQRKGKYRRPSEARVQPAGPDSTVQSESEGARGHDDHRVR